MEVKSCPSHSEVRFRTIPRIARPVRTRREEIARSDITLRDILRGQILPKPESESTPLLSCILVYFTLSVTWWSLPYAIPGMSNLAPGGSDPNDSRAFESTVLERLLRWGAASIDKSLNQPVLPHAIIVFNASDGIDESEWDMETATKLLMEEIRGAIFREPALAPYVQSWLDRGKRINTTEELLQCYYATVTVIRIPARGTYMLMDQQAGKLFDLIKSRCATSTLRKRQVRMLANAERFQVYLQAAYDHFTKDLNSPFDFVKEALRHSPVPRDFGGNILSLAISIRDRAKDEETRTDAERIFSRLGPMIASCVMFDAVRQNLMGKSTRPQRPDILSFTVYIVFYRNRRAASG